MFQKIPRTFLILFRVSRDVSSCTEARPSLRSCPRFLERAWRQLEQPVLRHVSTGCRRRRLRYVQAVHRPCARLFSARAVRRSLSLFSSALVGVPGRHCCTAARATSHTTTSVVIREERATPHRVTGRRRDNKSSWAVYGQLARHRGSIRQGTLTTRCQQAFGDPRF